MKKSKILISFIILIAALIIIQLADSYCTELFDRIQSLFLKDLIMDRKNMSLEDATILINSVAIPFYIIAALAPLARMLVDYIGKEKVLAINFIVLAAGCAICMSTNNWLVFLAGNSIISFSTSVDIQYIYIVDKVRKEKRATIRGILAAVAAFAAMLVTISRKFFVGYTSYGWRGLYAVGIAASLVVVAGAFIVAFLNHTKIVGNSGGGSTDNEKNNKGALRLLIPLFVWGLAVPGIKFYNEPIVSMTYGNENLIQTVLLVQPAVTIVINLLCGFLADNLGRKKVVYGGIIASCISLGIFILIARCHINAPVLMGVMWGIMVGAYFSVTNILLLMVMEMAQKNRIGRFSAMAAYANAAGTTIGMVVISIVSKVSNTSVSKLVMLIPAAIITVILIRKIKS